MYTMENYYWGLVAYYLGAILIMVPLWRVTHFIPWFPLRSFFRVSFFAALATPMLVYREMIYLAPAWGVAVFEAIYPETSQGWERGLWPMVVTGSLLYASVLTAWLVFRRWRAGKNEASKGGRMEPTLSDIVDEQSGSDSSSKLTTK